MPEATTGHSRLIIAITLIIEVIIFVFLLLSYVKSRRKTMYSYKTAELFGALTFSVNVLAVTLITLIRTDFNNTDISLTISSIPNTVIFSYLLFMIPVILVTFLSVSVSNISLIRHEGKSVKNLLGAFLGFFLIICTVLVIFGWDAIYRTVIFKIYSKGYQWITVFDIAIPMFFASLVCYLECMLFGVSVCAVKCAKHYPKPDKDFMIIPGCAISKDGKPLPLLRGRADAAIEFAKYQEKETGKQVIFVPSGGQGDNECVSEACAIKNYLLSCEVPEDRIIMEDRSVSTLENMTFSKQVIDGVKPEAKVAFATTNYHVFRSGIYAIQAGIDADGIGSRTKWYFWPNAFVREFIALLSTKIKNHIVVALILLSASIASGLWIYFRIHF